MKIKTSELTGPALDWAVAQIKYKESRYKYGEPVFNQKTKRVYETEGLRQIGVNYSPSIDWAQGGPIIERGLIDIQAKFNSGSSIVPKGQWYWQASTVNEDDVAFWFDGPNPLIAAMRCFVASKFGDIVEIPEELVL